VSQNRYTYDSSFVGLTPTRDSRFESATGWLHWFDHLFERGDGPAQWAKAKLVRYADDSVVLARYISPKLRDWIEGKLEEWLGLQTNSSTPSRAKHPCRN
jgi:hypothetical protein